MEFENQQNEFTNSHLAQALPDLIKKNYEFRQDIRVEYAGDIRPYLEKDSLNDKESIKGLIINGRYLTINNEFFVEFEAYDIHNWKLLVRRQLFCPVQDLICVHDGFIMAIEKTISPFLNDALNIDEIITALEEPPKTRTPGYDLESDKNVKLDSLINLDDYTGRVIEPGRKQGQYGDRYYREFTFRNIPPDPENIKKQNRGQG